MGPRTNSVRRTTAPLADQTSQPAHESVVDALKSPAVRSLVSVAEEPARVRRRHRRSDDPFLELEQRRVPQRRRHALAGGPRGARVTWRSSNALCRCSSRASHPPISFSIIARTTSARSTASLRQPATTSPRLRPVARPVPSFPGRSARCSGRSTTRSLSRRTATRTTSSSCGNTRRWSRWPS